MNGDELIAALESAGVRLSVEGEHLIVDAPAGVVTDDLLAELSSRKQEVFDLLLESCPAKRETAVEDAILKRARHGPVSHRELMRAAQTAGANEKEARAAIRRLQSSGTILHNLTTGYVLRCLSPNCANFPDPMTRFLSPNIRKTRGSSRGQIA